MNRVTIKYIIVVLVFLCSTNLFAQPLGAGADKFIGNVAPSTENAATFEKYWNQVTPENASKWVSVEGTRDQYNWSGVDQAYNYAKANGFPFRFHTLIWGNQQPGWIRALSSAEQLEEIEEWFYLVGKRYPDIDYIDVVNEGMPGHNQPDGLNGRANYKAALGGNGATGYDWIIKSFELARKYIPNAKLFINDYNIIGYNNETTTYLTVINLLKARGLIDGIGEQAHNGQINSKSNTTLKGNLDRLAATGLPIHITELDLGNMQDNTTPDDNVQLSLYKRIFPIFWEHPGVTGITFWGYIQGQLWVSSAFLLRSDGTERPALQWLRSYLSSGNYRSFQSGDWNDLNTWEKHDGTNWVHPASSIPSTTAKSITVSGGHTVTITGNELADLLTVSTDGKLNVSAGASLTAGELFVDNQAEVTLSGNVKINNSLELKNASIISSGISFQYSDSSSLIYSGKTAQTTSDVEFPASGGPLNLEIRNTAGVTLHATRKIGGMLSLTGKLKLEDNDLTVASAKNTSSTRFVVVDGLGKLKQYCSNSAEVYFPIGASAFSPVWITNTGTGDTIDVSVAIDSDPVAYGGRVKMKWNIGELAQGGGIYSIKFGWMSSAEESAFRSDRAGNARIFNLTDTTEAGSGEYITDFVTLPYTLMRGGIDELGPFSVGKFRDITGVSDKVIMKQFELSQNYPNPFNPTTVIKYNLPQAADVQINIYNILGVKVKTLVNQFQNSGSYQINWNATDDQNNSVASGIYFYRLESGNSKLLKKMILIR